MADPLSITASIIAVLQATSAVISLCYDYRSGVKNASKEMKQLTDEVAGLRDILESILRLADESGHENAHFSTLKLLTKPGGVLPECKAEMLLLETELKPATGLRALSRTLKWPYVRGEVAKKIQDNTEQIKLQTEALNRNLESRHSRDEYERMKILIDAPDASANYTAARNKRDLGSGEWLMQDDRYKAWRDSTGSLLWLHGIPGCGKTLICSRIIDDLTSITTKEENVALTYFFFDFTTVNKQTYEKALRSTILQLSRQSSTAWQILTESTEYFEDIRQRMETTWSVSVNFLQKLLDRYLLAYNTIYFIFDAFDQSTDQDVALGFVRDLLVTNVGRIKILITYRHERNIQQTLDDVATQIVAITAETVDHDIRLHIQKRLSHDRHLQKWPENLRADIEISLIEGSVGMFRWVDCQLDMIQRCLKPSAVRIVLSSLPKTLDETYTNIIKRIDEEYLSDALTVFQWLIYSRRVLRLEEIAEVLAIEYSGEPEFSPELRLQDARDILSVCSSTITIGTLDAGSSAADVRLAHASVKEFLLAGGGKFGLPSESNFDARIVHEKLARGCIAYLLYLGSADVEESSILKEFPLVDYAARNWIIHAREADESADILSAALQLLRRNQSCFERLHKFYDIDWPWRKIETKLSLPGGYDRKAQVPPASLLSPLYYASWAGLTSVVKTLLHNEDDVNERCGFFGDAISAAAARGHQNIVKILLQNGADPNASGGFQRGPLMAAATAGHEAILELLLAAGADIQQSYYRHGDPLLAAIRNGHEGAVRLLIKHGANAMSPRGKSDSPIETAAAYGHASIVKILLDAGAKCNDRTLKQAAQNSHEQVLEVLRDHLAGPQEPSGALVPGEIGSTENPKAKPPDTSNTRKIKQDLVSLSGAAAGGLINSVHQLLDSGVDPNLWEKWDWGTPLSQAACRGHLSVVQLLLHRGADINLQPNSYTPSPLDIAARHGHLSVVRELICAQPPPSIGVREDTFGNPLESAAYSGNLEVFMEILNLNPDVNAICTRGYSGGTALATAAAVGHETMVQLLLSRGADVNLVPQGSSKRNFTPLASAAFGGHIGVAKKLLDAGADIRMTSGWRDQTPLAIAAAKRQTEMVAYLLDSDENQDFDLSALEAVISTTPDDCDLLRILLSRYIELSFPDLDSQDSPPTSTSRSSLAKSLTMALMQAVELNNPAAVKVLVEYGADVNGKDRRGYTSLHQAAHHNSTQTAIVLIQDFHADIYAELPNGSLPIAIAAQHGRNECIKLFLSHKVNINVLSHELRTPLHTAVDNLNGDTVKLLIAEGARTDLMDQDGMTALDIAEYHAAREEGESFSSPRKHLLETFVEEVKKRDS